jgi:diguanylate cyclase (GGDEF)-like protein
VNTALGRTEAAPSDILAELDALIGGGPLTVAFQPIIDLSTGEIAAYEVLGRAGPIAGKLGSAARSPATLLDEAHRHGRLLALDRRWREIAIAAIAAQGDDRPLFFLNVDPRIAEDPSAAPGFTLALVRAHGLAPERFVLELTEAPSRDPEAIERVLERYAEQGFRVALDDLGAGQQTLANLLRLRPHIVKLDRALLRGAEGDPTRAHLLGALAEFARRTGIELVAEGIETEDQLRAVCEAGIPLAQGFLLGRPAPEPTSLSTSARAALHATARRTAAPEEPRLSPNPSADLLRMIERLRGGGPLEAKLEHVARCAAGLLGVDRVSVRLLDHGRTRLLVAARVGCSAHLADAEFAVGEGLAGWVVAHAAPLRVDHADHDPRFSERPDRVAPLGSFLGVPLCGVDACIGVLATSSPAPRAFGPEHERWLRLVADVAAPHLEVARLQRLARTDPLTAALNRRALDGLLPGEEDASTAPLSVAAFDIDDFKHVNDRLGHAAGDAVLQAITQTFAEVVRRNDRTVRLGGEEFLLVLPGASLAEAWAVAERVRDVVASREMAHGATLTVSAGVAERRPGEGRASLLARADAALYQAKALGKNRVVSAAPGAEDAVERRAAAQGIDGSRG